MNILNNTELYTFKSLVFHFMLCKFYLSKNRDATTTNKKQNASLKVYHVSELRTIKEMSHFPFGFQDSCVPDPKISSNRHLLNSNKSSKTVNNL